VLIPNLSAAGRSFDVVGGAVTSYYSPTNTIDAIGDSESGVYIWDIIRQDIQDDFALPDSGSSVDVNLSTKPKGC
jgi:hypothetical protein